MAIIKIEFNTIQSQRKRPYLVIHKFNQNFGISGYRSPLVYRPTRHGEIQFHVYYI